MIPLASFPGKWRVGERILKVSIIIFEFLTYIRDVCQYTIFINGRPAKFG